VKNASLATVALLLASLAALPAMADTAAVQSALKAAYMNQCALVVAGNYDGFSKTVTPDYVDIQPDGKKVPLAQVVAAMKQNAAVLKVTSCDVSFNSVTQNADGSVVAAVTATQHGQLVSTPQPVVATSVANDTWVQQNGNWLLKSSAVSEVTVSVAGKVVQHIGGSAAASPSPAPPR
jgi:hypothetical protein